MKLSIPRTTDIPDTETAEQGFELDELLLELELDEELPLEVDDADPVEELLLMDAMVEAVNPRGLKTSLSFSSFSLAEAIVFLPLTVSGDLVRLAMVSKPFIRKGSHLAPHRCVAAVTISFQQPKPRPK